MTINTLKSGWKIDVSRKGQRFRKLVTTSRSDAEAIERDAIYRLDHGLPLDTQTNHVDFRMCEIVELTNDLRWSHQKSDSQYRTAWNFLDFIEGRKKPVRQILTQSTLTAFELRAANKGLSVATLNKYKSVIRAMIDIAHEQGYIDVKPVVKLKKCSKRRQEYLNDNNEHQFLYTLQQLNHHELYDLAQVAIDTGGRVGELLAIEAKDIDGDLLYIGDTKNGEDRVVPLTDRALAILENRTDRTGVLFDLDYEQIKYQWRKARTHLGYGADYCFHVCRHTFITRLLQQGNPTVMVQRLSGHKDANSLSGYAHADINHLRAMVKP